MAVRDIVVIGGSAGSFRALRTLVQQLPADLPASLFVAIHRLEVRGVDEFDKLLKRHAKLPLSFAYDGQSIQSAYIYLAPSRSCLAFENNVIRVVPDLMPLPPRNINALFVAAARSFGERVIGVVLSGMLDDGAAGCWEIRKHGGVTIAQSPAEAEYSSMPSTAMRDAPVHYCLTTDETIAKVQDLVAGRSVPAPSQEARVMIVEDEWVLASELHRQLEELRYTVVGTFSTGEEAVAKVQSVMPDLVIMDVGLAGKLKGTEAAAMIWRQYELPIIFLTAHADEKTIADAQPSMPYAFLSKPHHAGQLHSAIQLALGRRRQEISRRNSTHRSAM